MDAGDAQFLSRNEFEHCLSRRRGGGRIDVVGDARIGEGEPMPGKWTMSPQMRSPSPLDSTTHAVWPGVWPGVGKARTPGAT